MCLLGERKICKNDTRYYCVPGVLLNTSVVLVCLTLKPSKAEDYCPHSAGEEMGAWKFSEVLEARVALGTVLDHEA